jgi:hypothetical protein
VRHVAIVFPERGKLRWIVRVEPVRLEWALGLRRATPDLEGRLWSVSCQSVQFYLFSDAVQLVKTARF